MAFHYLSTCFKCVIISRTECSFLSMQSVMSVRKRSGFLSLNWLSELVCDSELYESRAPSDNSSEGKGGFEDEPGVSHLQPERPTSRGHASSSASNTSNEEGRFQGG